MGARGRHHREDVRDGELHGGHRPRGSDRRTGRSGQSPSRPRHPVPAPPGRAEHARRRWPEPARRRPCRRDRGIGGGGVVISAIVAVLVFAIVISVIVVYARDPGPNAVDIAVAYELAWD